MAAGEVTTGNRSFDNINQDNMSLGNKSGFKTDFNQSHQEGAMQILTAVVLLSDVLFKVGHTVVATSGIMAVKNHTILGVVLPIGG